MVSFLEPCELDVGRSCCELCSVTGDQWTSYDDSVLVDACAACSRVALSSLLTFLICFAPQKCVLLRILCITSLSLDIRRGRIGFGRFLFFSSILYPVQLVTALAIMLFACLVSFGLCLKRGEWSLKQSS